MTTTPTREITLFINEDGGIMFVHDDEVAESLDTGIPPLIRRASHVEPTTDGKWSVDVAPIAGSPTPMVIGTWPSRNAALCAEVEWVRDFLAGPREAFRG